MKYIYLLKDPISKEVVWIGETSKPKQRYNQHCWGTAEDSEEKKAWLQSLKNLRMKPLFEIVDTAYNKREALIKENNLIVHHIKKGCKLFNLINSKTVKQYDMNGRLIGEFANCVIASEITGISARTDRYSAGNYQWSYDEFNPELVCKKALSKKVNCKPVLQIDKSGNIINEFEGVRIAFVQTGIDHRSISQVAAGSNVRKTAGGFKWQYK
jgi:predicted GIY-YIG superfamily endonuclease